MAVGMDDLDNDIKRTIDDAMDAMELLPYRYENVLGKVRQQCHAYPKKPESLAKGSNMNIYEIGLLMIGWTISCVWFYTLGINTGYIDGRRAVRKQYEQRDKVRA